MDRIIQRKSISRRLRRAICLVFLCLITAMWTGSAYAANEVRIINSSGNVDIQPSVDPSKKSEGYSAILYDNKNGLPTSDANAIAQTSEGFIWIGSYAGLIRYDGNDFERFDSTTGISNVRSLYTDSRDRLWIGTNDTGIFLMENERFRQWSKREGLESTSIRAIAEDEDGTIYVGTMAGIGMIDNEMRLTLMEDKRIRNQMIRDLHLGSDGLVYGLTQNGDLFTLKGGEIVTFLSQERSRVKGVLSIIPVPDHPGEVYLGTDSSMMYHGNLAQNFPVLAKRDVAPLTGIERFEYINNQLWICAGNGMGSVDSIGFHRLKNVPMTSSVGHVMTDYEGNLWFTSTRQGVMKIVPNQFTDFYERYNLPSDVVNATCMYGRRLFIGTDTGLTVMEEGKTVDTIPLNRAVTVSGKELEVSDLLEYLEGSRIRSIITDSQGRLWISAWRSQGLIRYDQDEIVVFNVEDGLVSDRIRTVVEQEDGSFLAVCTGGLSVIRDDRVECSYTEQNGISVTELLTAVEGYNHELIIGSDGGGIYIIQPDEDETLHLGLEDGLNSEVILRIKRSLDRDVYWIVTSNSLAYMTPNYEIFTIDQFPYPNNYDVIENGKGDAWVLCSSGIYVLPTEELLTNDIVEPIFYGIPSGLPYVATANSYSDVTAEGDLYIAGTSGVVKVNIQKSFVNIGDMKVAMPFVDIDGRRIFPDASGVFTIPRRAQKLTVHPFVFNYSLVDPQISYKLEGLDTTDTVIRRSDLTPLTYTNLHQGSYRFVIQVMDPSGDDDKTVSFRFVKEKDISEGAAGSIIMDITALFFLGGLLVFTSMYRRRGRMDDRLFFALVMINMMLATVELLSYLIEYSSSTFIRELMYMVNTLFYALVEVFPYIFLLYIDYRAYRDGNRIRKIKVPYSIPCILFILVLLINLKTGWIFSISKGNAFVSGSVDELVFVPVVFYALISIIKVYKINPRLAFLSFLLILTRVAWDIWYFDISSTAFLYSLVLICAHIHVKVRPVTEEETA